MCVSSILATSSTHHHHTHLKGRSPRPVKLPFSASPFVLFRIRPGAPGSNMDVIFHGPKNQSFTLSFGRVKDEVMLILLGLGDNIMNVRRDFVELSYKDYTWLVLFRLHGVLALFDLHHKGPTLLYEAKQPVELLKFVKVSLQADPEAEVDLIGSNSDQSFGWVQEGDSKGLYPRGFNPHTDTAYTDPVLVQELHTLHEKYLSLATMKEVLELAPRHFSSCLKVDQTLLQEYKVAVTSIKNILRFFGLDAPQPTSHQTK